MLLSGITASQEAYIGDSEKFLRTTHQELSFPGCQQACKFHRETASVKQQIEPVIHTRGEEVITVGKDEDGGNVIRWQKPPPPRTSSVVYVVMTKEEGSVTWRQVTQARLNDISNSVGRLGDTGIRVLVVDPEGLVSRTGPWVPREVSLIHQKVLVIAEVAWEARVPRGVYLVTWEIDGGGLQGNLFTDTTCVTLSLWPNTIYHVQKSEKS
ncbi:hypothetical protein J437_LFUL001473 [Ladona fulva]|uniref:Uncharacterized protein n=1 Tax=Ladona fulva TaxID=123851 RepID=A0A8K0KB67_LADFU|nr:hypothetical protein J437_LFUL001473 [Ladona fulva]